jgi:flagellar biogenesis protein FliO
MRRCDRLPAGPGASAMSPLTTYVVETLVTLLAVVALAVLVLAAGRRLGLGRPIGPVDLLGKLPLDARRAVYLVRIGKIVYVVGASEAGLTRLGEVDADSLPPSRVPETFGGVLARLRKSGEPAAGKGGNA